MNVHRRRRPLIYLIPNTSRLTSAPTSVSGVVLPSLRPPSVVDTIYSGSVVSPRLTVSFTSSRSLPTPTSVRWTLWVPPYAFPRNLELSLRRGLFPDTGALGKGDQWQECTHAVTGPLISYTTGPVTVVHTGSQWTTYDLQHYWVSGRSAHTQSMDHLQLRTLLIDTKVIWP